MWVRCQLCGCLVEPATLRPRHYERPDRRGEPRAVVQVVCRDTSACAARSGRVDHWYLVHAEVPRHREPAEDAPLFRCLQCDVAATAVEVDVARVRDDSDGTWFTEITCADTARCERRQYEDTPLRIDPPRCTE